MAGNQLCTRELVPRHQVEGGQQCPIFGRTIPPLPFRGVSIIFHIYIFYAFPKWKVAILYQLNNIITKVFLQDYNIIGTKYSQKIII